MNSISFSNQDEQLCQAGYAISRLPGTHFRQDDDMATVVFWAIKNGYFYVNDDVSLHNLINAFLRREMYGVPLRKIAFLYADAAGLYRIRVRSTQPRWPWHKLQRYSDGTACAGYCEVELLGDDECFSIVAGGQLAFMRRYFPELAEIWDSKNR